MTSGSRVCMKMSWLVAWGRERYAGVFVAQGSLGRARGEMMYFLHGCMMQVPGWRGAGVEVESSLAGGRLHWARKDEVSVLLAQASDLGWKQVSREFW